MVRVFDHRGSILGTPSDLLVVSSDPRGDLYFRHGHVNEGIDPTLRKTAIFFLILLLLGSTPIRARASNGYGEDSPSLGQFTDDYLNETYVSDKENIVRNASLNAMELNSSDYIYLEYDHFLTILVDSSRIDEVLTDFPILITLSDSAGLNNTDVTNIFDEVGDSYQKLSVVDADLNELYVDVEYWSAADSEAFIWVSCDLSDVDNVTLYLFFDGTATNNTDYIGLSGSDVAANVWDSDFEVVLHLSEQTGDFLDSTSNKYNASAQGTVNRGTQRIDGGIDLPGTNDYVRIDTAGILDGLDEATIEAWVNLDALGSDRSVLGDWNAGGTDQNSMLFYDVAPNNKWRVIFRDSNGGAPGVTSFGTAGPSLNWYHVASSYTRNDKVYGYENGVETVGLNTGNFALQNPNNLYYIGVDEDIGRDLNGKIDEVRLSSTTRSQSWINATYLSGLDDLLWLDYSAGTGGYFLEGWFNTTDFMNGLNGSCLVWLTNTTIPESTTLKIQFSDDEGISWVDNHGSPGSNTLTGGFEALDLRDLNCTSITTRYNFTGTNQETPRVYQSRLVSTENGAGEGAVITVESDAPWIAIAIILSIIAFLLAMGTRR